MDIPRWGKDFELGLYDIDLQHEVFLDLIRRFAKLVGPDSDAEYRTRLVAEMIQYARFHFMSEENLMRASGYPDLAHHQMIHLQLLDELNYTVHDRTNEQLIDFLVNWFTHHTQGVDREFAQWLAAHPS